MIGRQLPVDRVLMFFILLSTFSIFVVRPEFYIKAIFVPRTSQFSAYSSQFTDISEKFCCNSLNNGIFFFSRNVDASACICKGIYRRKLCDKYIWYPWGWLSHYIERSLKVFHRLGEKLVFPGSLQQTPRRKLRDYFSALSQDIQLWSFYHLKIAFIRRLQENHSWPRSWKDLLKYSIGCSKKLIKKTVLTPSWTPPSFSSWLLGSCIVFRNDTPRWFCSTWLLNPFIMFSFEISWPVCIYFELIPELDSTAFNSSLSHHLLQQKHERTHFVFKMSAVSYFWLLFLAMFKLLISKLPNILAHWF